MTNDLAELTEQAAPHEAVGTYLAEQLESIACQTRAPDELIVCDDASQDGTVAVVETFARDVRWPVPRCRRATRWCSGWC